MIFPTIEFAAFFAVVLTLNWLLMPNPRAWKPFILVASYVFYGYADWRFCALLAVSTLWNQVAAIAIQRSREPAARKRILAVAIVGNLGLLGWFKYYGFFVQSVNDALERVGLGAPLPLLQIALPVGISFFTFQAMSYVIDVYKRVIRPVGLMDFAIYEAFFPHLVAGPIVRAREFLPQLATPRSPRNLPAGPALFLIVGGLVKKIVIADYLAESIVDPVFGAPQAHNAWETLVAVYGYAVQIYCDFSAYTDMAIGLALLMGFRFPQNFNRPYTAVNLQDFWRRWHMTLSRWLRDYLYIPLGGSRKGRVRTYVNIMITMLLGGLWHGANWTFVVWGGIHGGGLALERWWTERRERRRSRGLAEQPSMRPSGGSAPVDGGTIVLEPYAPARATPAAAIWGARLLTFHVVCLGWVFFRSPDLDVAFEVLGRLLEWGGPSPLVTVPVLVAVTVGLSLQWIPDAFWHRIEVVFSARPIVLQGLILGAVLVLINAVVGEQGVAPFLYFRF